MIFEDTDFGHVTEVPNTINWSNLILWLPLSLEVLSNMCIAITCLPGCNVTNFETNLIILMKSSFYIIQGQDKNLNIFGTKKTFKLK